jgi:hypothetical protein
MTMRCYKFSAAERKLVMAEAELPEPGPGTGQSARGGREP